MTFSELYTSNYRRSFLFVKSYVHDEMTAEDIVSDVLVHLWKVMNEQTVDNVEALLITTLKNRSLDHLKHQAIQMESFKNIKEIQQKELEFRINTLSDCDPNELISKEIQEIVDRSLRSLPEMTQMIYRKSRVDGESNKEIAEELGVTVKTVEYHITKTLKILRVSLKDYFPLFLLLYYVH